MRTTILIISLLLASFVFTSSKKANNPITSFIDCDNCPKMITVPSGSVFVGSHENEIGRKKRERPRIKATIKKSFALAETEVTLGQYRLFMEETKYKSKVPVADGEPLIGCNYYDGKSYGYVAEHNWKNPGYPQRESDPVVCVSWSDATAYVAWLSKKTGREYRLPNAVEFEYASRAGSSSPWFWGTNPADACEYANIGDIAFSAKYPNEPSFPCLDGYVYTTQVRRFKPNAFGLYDMVGNAWEWTDDCYAKDLTNAAVDGTSYSGDDKDCSLRTPKGGAWISGISWSRAAVRSRDGADYKSFMLGFRVAADITE